ncbi:MAG: zf-HC2 domain-containing protein [Candidatus Marinimicrobia bacterium]|nr:zf-HC2 domain-containing protein [Candidatus Neomarinimicrobiota bacterium]
MDCYSFEKIISDYIESNLNPKERQEASEHIAECQRCRDKLADMINILSAMKTLPRYRTRSDFESRLMVCVDRQKQQKEHPFLHVLQNYSRAISVAAAVLLFAATSLFIYTSVSVPKNSAAIPAAELRSVDGGRGLPAAVLNSTPSLPIRIRKRRRRIREKQRTRIIIAGS